MIVCKLRCTKQFIYNRLRYSSSDLRVMKGPKGGTSRSGSPINGVANGHLDRPALTHAVSCEFETGC